MPGLFAEALKDRKIYNLKMNEVRFVSFRSNEYRGIGTADLNSCTAVMIVSSNGAILAYIAPHPDNARMNDPDAGHRHICQMMDKMGDLYRQHIEHFSVDKPSLIVSALYEGQIALPSQRDVIESKLRQWGLNPSTENYNVIEPPLPENGKGTVFVDARQGGFPVVYVEDRIVGKTASASYGTPASSSWGNYSSTPSAVPSSFRGYATASLAVPSSWGPYAPASSAIPSSARNYGSTSSAAPSSTTTKLEPNEPYCFVREGLYYYKKSGREIPLDGRPNRVWVYNAAGWSHKPGFKWRRTAGKNIAFKKEQ